MNWKKYNIIYKIKEVPSIENELSCIEYITNYKVKVRNAQMGTSSEFVLDRIFDPESQQSKLYDEIAKDTVDEVLQGYNGTIFAYGQSGSGKTFTMYGKNVHNEETKGIIPRAM